MGSPQSGDIRKYFVKREKEKIEAFGAILPLRKGQKKLVVFPETAESKGKAWTGCP